MIIGYKEPKGPLTNTLFQLLAHVVANILQDRLYHPSNFAVNSR